MAKKKQVRVYQLFVAHELTYTSTCLNKTLRAAEIKARETLSEDGVPDDTWYTIESVVMDLIDSETETIKINWEICIDATVKT